MSKKIVISVSEEKILSRLQKIPNTKILKWDMLGPAPVSEIDIVVPPYMNGVESLKQLDGVKTHLVQWPSIGFDGVAKNLPEGVTFANAASVHEASTAELAVGLAIASLRGIPEAVTAKTKRAWEPKFRPSLADRQVLLVGYGGVAKATEDRLLPFETDIVRVAHKARAERNSAGQTVHVHGVSELKSLIGEADVVIVTLPLNENTKQLIDAEMLSFMRDEALLINVGRGGVVDTPALVNELKTGRIKAALDVVDPEPLPPEHELWGCENLLIMPHVGGDTSAMLPRLVALIGRQVQHILNNEPFENVIFGAESG